MSCAKGEGGVFIKGPREVSIKVTNDDVRTLERGGGCFKKISCKLYKLNIPLEDKHLIIR